MKTRTTLALLLLAAALGLILLVKDRSRSERANGVMGSPVLDIGSESVSVLRFARGDEFIVCEKTRDGWQIVKPTRVRADSGKISGILNAVGSLTAVEEITPEQMRNRGLSLDDYGLGGRPQASISIGKKDRERTLLVGHGTLDGMVYVRRPPNGNVIVASAKALSALPASTAELRDDSVAIGDPARAVKVEIERADRGFVRILKKGGFWIMQQPISGARLNGARMTKLLKSLYGMKAGRFAPDVDERLAGLDESHAPLRISVWTDDNTVMRFAFGKAADETGKEVYARVSTCDSIVTVAKELPDSFGFQPNDFRDHSIVPVSRGDLVYIRLRDGERKLDLKRGGAADGWVVGEQGARKADPAIMDDLLGKLASLRAVEFLDNAGTNTEYGLKRGGRSIELSTVPITGEIVVGEAGQPAFRKVLDIGDEAWRGGDIYARFEDESCVMKVAGGPLQAVIEGRYAGAPDFENVSTADGTPRWVNPLLYSDRTVLEIASASVAGITLWKEDGEQSVAREENGGWVSVVPADGVVCDDVVRGILDSVRAMNAVRIECAENANLATYGLDPPSARLTFGLAEGTGIRKTLLLGFLAHTDGVYAMVQGREAVFVLSRPLVGKLLRDLVSRPSHGG